MHEAILKKATIIAVGEPRERVLDAGEYPPCFESLQQYEAWLESADRDYGHAPPMRSDWPREPNYCRDCDPAFRLRMCLANRCLFPETRFKQIGEGEDAEVVGYTPRT